MQKQISFQSKDNELMANSVTNDRQMDQSIKGIKETFKSIPQQYQQLQFIFEKKPESRNNQQMAILNNFINKNSHLSGISEKISNQLALTIIKYGKIIGICQGSILCEKGRSADSIFIVLEGKLKKINNKKSPERDIQSNQAIYKKINYLLPKAQEFIKKKRRRTLKNLRSFNGHIVIEKLPLLKRQSQLAAQSVLLPQQVYGLDNFVQDKEVYLDTIVTVHQSVILQIPSLRVLQALSQYQQKKNQRIQDRLLKSSIVFKKIESDKLKFIAEKCETITLRKGQFFYKEGQLAQHFYILFEGQIKLSKYIQLCAQNPNNLYINRSFLIQKGETKPNLPYANLKQIYNYRPIKKILHLGIITDICLFGEEQVFERIPREVNAQVTSIQATAYKISYNNLQTIIGDKKSNLNDFKQMLYESLTKNRIMYRQQQLSKILSFQNSSNMKYFYLDSDNNHDFNNTSRTEQLKKINRSISPQISPEKKQQKGPKHQPYISRHNFHKLNTITHILHSNKNLQNGEDAIRLTPHEANVSELAHYIKNIAESVKKRSTLSEKMHLNKYSINVKNPLIDMVFFNSLKKQQLKIQTTYRKKRFSSINSSKIDKSRTIDSSPKKNKHP